MLAAGLNPEFQSIFHNDRGGRHFRGITIEGFLPLHMLLGKPIKTAVGEMAGQAFQDEVAHPVHAKCEKFHDDQVVKSIHHQAAQAVCFRVDQPPGVGLFAQVQNVPTQADGLADPVLDERGIDNPVGIVGQHAQSDSRVPVVKGSAHSGAVRIHHLHQASVGDFVGGFLNQALEDPRVQESPG